MPSIKKIVAYWAIRQDECDLGVDWAEAQERCWRCGYKASLERCHIIPHSLGGSDEPANLVLLCGRCHREAPNIDDAHLMWTWLRATCVPFYDLYWTSRGAFEFEDMFGRAPFTAPEFEQADMEKVNEFLRDEMRRTTVHFGEGRMNPATIACVFAKVEERVTGKRPEPVEGSPVTRRLLSMIGWAKPKPPHGTA